MTEPEVRSYHHPDLKRALLDAAIAILKEEGSKGLTLRKLAQRAGVSHAAPYRHFANKDAILGALMLEGNRLLALALNKARIERPGAAADRLMALGRAYLAFARENPEHLDILFSREGMDAAGILAAEPGGLEALAAYDSFAPLETTIRECQAEGSLDPAADSGALAFAVWSQVHGLALLRKEGVVAGMSAMRGGTEEATMEAVLGIMAGLYDRRRGKEAEDGQGGASPA